MRKFILPILVLSWSACKKSGTGEPLKVSQTQSAEEVYWQSSGEESQISPAALKSVIEGTVYVEMSQPDGSWRHGTGFAIGSKYIMISQSLLRDEDEHQAWLDFQKRIGSQGNGPLIEPTRDYRHFEDFDCSRMKVITNYQKRVAPSWKAESDQTFGPQKTLYCKKIILANWEHGIAIVELKSNVGTMVLHPMPLSFEPAPDEAELLIVGHPKEQDYPRAYKQISSCKQRRPQIAPKRQFGLDYHNLAIRFPHTMLHDCDYAEGMSGAPIISYQNFKVIGLHWNSPLATRYLFWNGKEGDEVCPRLKIAQEHGCNDFIPVSKGGSMVTMASIFDYLQTVEQASSTILPDELKQVFRK